MRRTTVLHLSEYGDRTGFGGSVRPFGAEALEGLGVTNVWATAPAHGRVGTKLRDVVEHRLGYPVERALLAGPGVASADLVLAHLEHQARLPATLRRRGIPPYSRRPLVMLTCWLAEWARTADAEGRRALVRRYGAVDVLVHWSGNQGAIYRDLGFRDEQLLPVPYGVETAWFALPDEPEPERDLDVVAVGQDLGRDYATLFEAAGGIPTQIDVYCTPLNLPTARPPQNIRVHAPVPVTTYRDLLRRARVVVVPTRDLAYPTGQTVAIEAAAAGAAVVVTGTRPMGEYFNHGTDALMPPPGDPGALRDAIADLLSDDARRGSLARAGQRRALAEYDSTLMWRRIRHGLAERGLIP